MTNMRAAQRTKRRAEVASASEPEASAIKSAHRRADWLRQIKALHAQIAASSAKMSRAEAAVAASNLAELFQTLKQQHNLTRKAIAVQAWPHMEEVDAASKLRFYTFPPELKGPKREERRRKLVLDARRYLPLAEVIAKETGREPGYYLLQIFAGTRHGTVGSVDFDSEQLERHAPFVDFFRRAVGKLSARHDLPRFFREVSRYATPDAWEEMGESGELEFDLTGPDQVNPKGLISRGVLSEFLRHQGPVYDAIPAIEPRVPLYRGQVEGPIPVLVQLASKPDASLGAALDRRKPRPGARKYRGILTRYAEIQLAIVPGDEEGRCKPVFIQVPLEATIDLYERPPGSVRGRDARPGPVYVDDSSWWATFHARHDPRRRNTVIRYWASGTGGEVLRNGKRYHRAVVHDARGLDLPPLPSGGELGEWVVAEEPTPEGALWLEPAFYPFDAANVQRFLVDIPGHPSSEERDMDVLIEVGSAAGTGAFPYDTFGAELEEDLLARAALPDSVLTRLERAIRLRTDWLEKKSAKLRRTMIAAYEEALARLFPEPEDRPISHPEPAEMPGR